MEEEQESKGRRIFRYVTTVLAIILFLVVVISAIMRKFGA